MSESLTAQQIAMLDQAHAQAAETLDRIIAGYRQSLDEDADETPREAQLFALAVWLRQSDTHSLGHFLAVAVDRLAGGGS